MMASQNKTMQCNGLLGDCKGFTIAPASKTVAFDMGGEPLHVGAADLVAVEMMADGYTPLGSHTWRDNDWFELRRAATRKHVYLGSHEITDEPALIDRVLICVRSSCLELPIVDLVLLHADKAMALNSPAVADALKHAELWASRLNLSAKKAPAATP